MTKEKRFACTAGVFFTPIPSDVTFNLWCKWLEKKNDRRAKTIATTPQTIPSINYFKTESVAMSYKYQTGDINLFSGYCS